MLPALRAVSVSVGLVQVSMGLAGEIVTPGAVVLLLTVVMALLLQPLVVFVTVMVKELPELTTAVPATAFGFVRPVPAKA